MGKSSSSADPKQQSSSSSRDTSKSSSGGSKFSSSGSRYGKPDIRTYPDGRRPGYKETSDRSDQRYHKGSSLTDGYGGKSR